MQENNRCRYLTRETAVAIAATAIWYLFAHGYRFANNMYSHDALLEICQNDSAWQISLGRFIQPILIFLRGGLGSPWLISACALLWYCLGNCLLLRLLKVRHAAAAIIITGVMVCNPTLISANAAFLPWVDFYALALFLSILGVCLCREGGWIRNGCGVLSLMLVMGIYQAYICVAIVLFMTLLLREAQGNAEMKAFLKRAARYCCVLVSAAVLYFLIWQGFLLVFGFEAADSYNGMASLGDYSNVSLLSLLALVYRKVFEYFWNPDTFVTMMFRGISLSAVWKYILRIANAAVAACLLWSVTAINIRAKTKLWQRLFQAGLLFLLPAGMNFVCIMSKGMEHTLMVYAFVFLYVLAVVLAEAAGSGEGNHAGKDGSSGDEDHAGKAGFSEEANRVGKPWGLKGKCSCLMRLPVWLSVLCVLWSNVVYANQAYLKKELQERAVTSLMTRIVAEIEGTEGYIPGVTPIAFSGSFEKSPYLQQIEGFEELLPYGMGKTALTYIGPDYAFLTFEVSVLMNYTRIDAKDPEVMGMPTYPSPGSIDYVGDILVIKISD